RSSSKRRAKKERPPWHRQLVAAELSVEGPAEAQRKAIGELVQYLREHPEQGKPVLWVKEREQGGTYFTGEIRVTFVALPYIDELQQFLKHHELFVVSAQGPIVVFGMHYPTADFPDVVAAIRKDPRVKDAE